MHARWQRLPGFWAILGHPSEDMARNGAGRLLVMIFNVLAPHMHDPYTKKRMKNTELMNQIESFHKGMPRWEHVFVFAHIPSGSQ